MWHTKSFYVGSLLGLLLWGCGSNNFAGDSASSQLLSIEVDDSTLSKSDDGTLDASDAGSITKNSDVSDSGDSSDSKSSSSNREDSSSCAQTLEANSELIRIAGSQKQVSIQSQELVLARITGDRNQLDLNLSGKDSSAQMKGICLFIAGHQNKALIKIQHPLSALFIKARGDQALVEIEISKEGKIGKIVWDARGNSPHMNIRGPKASYSCPEATGKSKVTCQ